MRGESPTSDTGVSPSTGVSIEGSPLRELYLTLLRLVPGCAEICGYAQDVDSGSVAVSRSREYSPLELHEPYIIVGCERIHLCLDEKGAMGFIVYIREWRKELDRAFAQSALDFLDQPTP